MEKHSENHNETLIFLNFDIRLHVRETHHIIHHHQNHGFVEVFHLIGPIFLERVRSTSHNHSNNRLEDQATYLEK